jgi:integrase
MRQWKPIKKHPNVYEYETRRGKRYGIRRTFTNDFGKREEYTKSGFTNIPDAQITLNEFERSQLLGNTTQYSSRSITLNEWWEKLLKRNADSELWRPATIHQKTTYYNKHLKEPFGDKRMVDIKRNAYQNYIDALVIKGLADATIRTINSVMQVILNDAVKHDVLDKNRLAAISIRGAVPAKNVAISESDYVTLVTKARELFDTTQLTQFFMLCLGARREEVAGLQVRSLQKMVEDGEEYYRITYYKGRTTDEPNGGPLKNEGSYRSNYARGELYTLLKKSLQTCKDTCERTHRIFNGETWLFLRPDTGMPPYPDNINRFVGDLRDATGIEVRPHMLRHYFATQALESGLPGMSVAFWLGHKTISMTQSYTRPTERGALRVIEGMQSELFTHDTNDSKH